MPRDLVGQPTLGLCGARTPACRAHTRVNAGFMGWPNRLKIPRDQRIEEPAQLALLANGRPQLIKLVRSKLVSVEQLHLTNSPSWTIYPQLCEFGRIDCVSNSRIDMDDDCVGDFLFSDITARGSKIAGQITGVREMAAENMTFHSLHIQAQTGFTCASAKDISFQDVVINTKKGSGFLL